MCVCVCVYVCARGWGGGGGVKGGKWLAQGGGRGRVGRGKEGGERGAGGEGEGGGEKRHTQRPGSVLKLKQVNILPLNHSVAALSHRTP